MKKIIVSIIVIGLLLTTSIASVNAFDIEGNVSEEMKSVPATPIADVYVDDDNTEGPWDGSYDHPYQFIQDGIDNAVDGDMVFVFNGNYNEYLKFSKSIKLIGENKYTTIIEKRVVILNTDNAMLSGFTLLSPRLAMRNSSNCTVSGNIIANMYEMSIVAIGLDHSPYATVKGNTVTNLSGTWATAIEIDDSPNSMITGNTVANLSGTWATAIEVYRSPNSMITGNTVANLSGGFVTAILIEGSPNSMITGNTVANLSGGWATGIELKDSITHGTTYGTSITENTILNLDGNWATGILLDADTNDNVVKENTIKYSSGGHAYGISLIEASDNTIADNDISHINGYTDAGGIHIDRSSGNTISGNLIKESLVAIFVYSLPFMPFSTLGTSENNIFTNNEIINNEFGIVLWNFVKHNTISENTISNNKVGIYPGYKCKKNTIKKNEITDNDWYGIYLSNASKNKIIANNIKDTTYYGIYCERSSKNNHIYYNNFINNGRNAYDKGSNTWYNFKLFGKSMGNYWDDYTGTDNNGDGIGDTPYIIEGKELLPSQDKFPAMDSFDIEDVEVDAEIMGEKGILQSSSQSTPQSNPSSQQSSNPMFLQISQRLLSTR